MVPGGFRSRIGNASNFAGDDFAVAQLPARPAGVVPAPFNALDPLHLSGPRGSHPLALIDLPQMLARPTNGLDGAIEIDEPVLVGGSISGTIRIRSKREIRARSAVMRLVGVQMAERTRSVTEQGEDQPAPAGGTAAAASGPSGTTSAPATAPPETVSWVEVHGSVVEALPFTDPVLPTELDVGQVVDVPFTIPAPRLGPPTAHAGVAAVAWAVEAKWDIAMSGDERLCAYVDVKQHPDLLRAGVLTLPSGALNDAVTDEDATIAVEPLPPLLAGSPVKVTLAWPGAPGGRSARLELRLDVRGKAGLDLVLATVPIDRQLLAGGSVTIPLDADLPSTLQADGFEVGYLLRVTVDRKLRSDVHRERALVIYS